LGIFAVIRGEMGLGMTQLKLIAMDKEDLAILSTCCQDAVAKTGDFQYLPDEARFILVMNRYVWENSGKLHTPERRRSVLHFNRISNVKTTGIDRQNPDQVLSLLAVTFEPDELPAGSLHLVFSGDAAMRLEVECIEVQLSDLDAAWEASSQPAHQLK
jgi:hypothetical protein